MSGTRLSTAIVGALAMCANILPAGAAAQVGHAATTPAPGVVPPPVAATTPDPPPTPIVLTPTGPPTLPPPPLPTAAYLAAMQQLDSDRTAVAAWFADNPEALGTNSAAETSIRFNPGIEPFEVEPIDGTPATPTQEDQLLSVARTVGMLRAKLKAAQYPDWLYELAIRKYEAESVHALVDGAPRPKGLDWVVADIEQQRGLLRPDLPALSYVLFMGMNAATNAIIRSQPSGGEVWIISRLRFEVCRARFADPFDRSSCTRWNQMDPENGMPLSGTYVYQVGWIGGDKARGMRTVSFDKDKPEPVVFLVP